MENVTGHRLWQYSVLHSMNKNYNDYVPNICRIWDEERVRRFTLVMDEELFGVEMVRAKLLLMLSVEKDLILKRPFVDDIRSDDWFVLKEALDSRLFAMARVGRMMFIFNLFPYAL